MYLSWLDFYLCCLLFIYLSWLVGYIYIGDEEKDDEANELESVEPEYKQSMDDMSIVSNVNDFEPLVYEQTMDDRTLTSNVNDFEPIVYEKMMDDMTTVSDVNANFSDGLWT